VRVALRSSLPGAWLVSSTVLCSARQTFYPAINVQTLCYWAPTLAGIGSQSISIQTDLLASDCATPH